MDTIETLGGAKYALTESLLRIDAIATAATEADVIFRLGAAKAYVTAAADLGFLPGQRSAELLNLADKLYNEHPLAIGSADGFVVEPRANGVFG